MTTPVFTLTGVSYAYRQVPALDDVSLTIMPGQRVALLGANGSGKSTLLRLLAALCFADRGEIRAFGDPLTERRLQDEAANFAFRRRVGLVFQNPDVQLFNPTVFDELAFGPLQLNWEPDRIRAAIDGTLARFGIAHLRDRPPHRLSGGEKKRVALASVMIMDPEVLLLDEPTAALDPESQGLVIRFLMECRGSGRTVITATHDLDSAADIADIGFVLAGGRLAAAAAMPDLLRDGGLLRCSRLADGRRHVSSETMSLRITGEK
ncbi:ABC transporter ATP-binding protein [Rhodovastum atsumiense]|uniref:ABC transporter ATP-binding protein n=1 Tax=Rhodovastum atsumiense TaxID=504468 RepID=A0A5M6IXA4_9PROT|nr:ABC transporter ATP-binding protein [Rhodovastum atsumiense]